MEESQTPWLIAEVATSSGVAALGVWIGALVGVAAVVLGGILFCA